MQVFTSKNLIETIYSFIYLEVHTKISEYFASEKKNNYLMASDLDCDFHPDPSSLEQQESSTDIQFSLWHTFKSHIPRLILTVICDIILPLILFLLLQKRIKSVYALLIAGTPPLAMIFLKAIFSRTFDALGFLVLMGFVISAIVALITHNYVILLLEKSSVTGIISIIFGITLIPFRCCQHRCRWRPFAYYFYQDLVPTKRSDVGLPYSLFDDTDQPTNDRCEDEPSVPRVSRKEVAQVYEWIYEHCLSFRVSCYLITSIWSIGFLFEFLARLILILIHLSVNKIVIYANIILSSITVACVILTIICITKERKKTLATIKQWKQEYLNTQQQQQCIRSDAHVWVVTDDFNANNRIYEMNTYSF
jgi:hypothetical protein